MVLAKHRNFTMMLPYLKYFVTFLKKLLEENNFKIVISVLNMVHEVSSSPGLRQYGDLEILVPQCIAKIGDNKIAIRQQAFKIFKALISELGPVRLFPKLFGALKSGNWHIREEILHVFLASMLLINEYFNYDFIDLVGPVAELLDDDKAKIRFVASETLN